MAKNFTSVRIGDIYKVTIEKKGAKGDGLSWIGNMVIIIPGTEIGETTEIEITKILINCAIGRKI